MFGMKDKSRLHSETSTTVWNYLNLVTLHLPPKRSITKNTRRPQVRTRYSRSSQSVLVREKKHRRVMKGSKNLIYSRT